MSDTVAKVSKITKPIYMAKKHREIIDYTSGTNLLPIEFVLMDWDIPSGATAAIYAKKPSGAILFNSCTVDQEANSITLNPTLQMFAEAGRIPAQIQVLSDGAMLNSYLIEFVIEEKIVSDEAIESTNEFSAFSSILSSTQTLTESVVADYVEEHGITTGANASQAAQIESNRTNVAQASEDIEALTEIVNSLSTTVSQLSTTVSSLGETVGAMVTSVNGLLQMVSGLRSEMDSINEGIESYDLSSL